jgi:hypothetical protein
MKKESGMDRMDRFVKDFLLYVTFGFVVMLIVMGVISWLF